MCVEKLLGIQITERCKYIRVILSEISRIADHLTCIGASAMELGAMTVFLYMMKAREYLYELIEDGAEPASRSVTRELEGVRADIPPGFEDRCKLALPKLAKC